MTFIELAKQRFSVRKFSENAVSKETLANILEAGNLAPTAKNLQPQRIRILQSKEDFEKLDKLTPCRFGAPIVLAFSYDKDEEWKNPLENGVHSGIEDVSIVATHIMLQATDIGLATLWVNYFPNTEFEKAFDIPANERMVLLMPLGYAAPDAAPSTNHTKKKPLDATVLW